MKYLRTEITPNPKDENRCAHSCQWVRKIDGLYTCEFYNKVVDTGKFEDDDIGYGFERVQACIDEAFQDPTPTSEDKDTQ